MFLLQAKKEADKAKREAEEAERARQEQEKRAEIERRVVEANERRRWGLGLGVGVEAGPPQACWLADRSAELCVIDCMTHKSTSILPELLPGKTSAVQARRAERCSSAAGAAAARQQSSHAAQAAATGQW